MKKAAGISLYTPSNMDPDLRERVFVQRHRLLDQIVNWISQSLRSDIKRQFLFVGPRGSGKTLLVSMIEHRLSANDAIKDEYYLAWLGEDNVITGIIDLAIGLLDQLVKHHPEVFDYSCRDSVQGMHPDDAAEIILEDISSKLERKTIVLIMENIDLAFQGLQEVGQKKWRAFLQEKSNLISILTSQQLFSGVSSRDAVFFGFYEIHHLQPLSYDSARQLLRNIAIENEQFDLVKFLDTPTGRYRVRALHHLAGGNHRLYVELSSFISIDSLAGLVEALENLADELTPFFQERVRSLAPQQARIVQALCEFSGAVSVKNLSKKIFVQERNVSKQLGELKKKGYVISEKRGKESFYELAEPLMRLSMETKNQHGEPLRLIASFLKVWFSDEELVQEHDGEIGENLNRATAYKKAALKLNDGYLDLFKENLAEQFAISLKGADWEKAKTMAEELMCADPANAFTFIEKVYQSEDYLNASTDALSLIIELDGTPSKSKQNALLARAKNYIDEGYQGKALVDLQSILAAESVDKNLIAAALQSRGGLYEAEENYELALEDYSRLIEEKLVDEDNLLICTLKIGHINFKLTNTRVALDVFQDVLKLKDVDIRTEAYATLYTGLCKRALGHNLEAMTDFEKVLEFEITYDDIAIPAIQNIAKIGYELQDFEKVSSAVSYGLRNLGLTSQQKAALLLLRVVSASSSNDLRTAKADLGRVLRMKLSDDELKGWAYVNRGNIYAEEQNQKQAIKSMDLALSLENISPYLRSQAEYYKALMLALFGEYKAAIKLFNSVLKSGLIEKQKLGGVYRQKAKAELEISDLDSAIVSFTAAIKLNQKSKVKRASLLVERAGVYWEQGDIDNAIADYKSVLELLESDHDLYYSSLMKLALCYMRLNELSSSKDYFNRIIDSSFHYSEELISLAFASMAIVAGLEEDLEAQLEYISKTVQLGEFDSNTHSYAFDLLLACYLDAKKGAQLLEYLDAILDRPEIDKSWKIYILSIKARLTLQAGLDNLDSSIFSSFLSEAQSDDLELVQESVEGYLKILSDADSSKWESKFLMIVQEFKTNHMLSILDAIVPSTIESIEKSDWEFERTKAWCRSWISAAKEESELKISVSIMSAYLRYRSEGSDKALFDLPKEIRVLVTGMLKKESSR